MNDEHWGPRFSSAKLGRRLLLQGSAATAIAGGLSALLPRAGAFAQGAFPSKPIEILVPWGPGGGPSQISDAVSKISAELGLSKQPMVLSHKPGASGLIGTALVASQRGNGHIFLPAGGALLLQRVLGETQLDPLKDLTPLALSTLDSSVVIAAANSPYKTLAEVTAKLQKEPRSVTMAGAGGTGWDSVVANTLGAAAGVEFNQIPFASGAEVQAAVLGGQVAVGARQLSNAQELISAGQLKALAIFDAERNPRLPDVPTMRELGYDVVLNLARGWFGAPDIKPQEVAWYADLFKKLSEAPRWIDYVSKSGSENKYLGPVEWSEFIRDTMGTIDRIYRKMGLIK